MATQDDFSGTWRATHWYPTRDDQAEESSVHEMKAEQKGDRLILQSLPDQDESYMFMRLKIDGDIATGSWHESTKHEGEFEGAMYSGAGQLIVSKDKKEMQGLWAGAGLDRSSGKLKMYTGRWLLERA